MPDPRRPKSVPEAAPVEVVGPVHGADLRSLPWHLRVEVAENVFRKDFTQSEKAAIQRRLLAELSRPDRKRPGTRTDLKPSTCTAHAVQVEGAPRRRSNATEVVGRLFGEGEKVVRERLAVVEAAEKQPEKFKPLLQEMEVSSNVHGAFEVLHGRRSMAGLKSSKSVEWYTPPLYIEAAREVLGGIDLDPCSSKIANRTVRAERFFTAAEDGLKQEWKGRVWLNPPYCRQPGAFARKVIRDYIRGQVSAAILLLNGYSYDAAWFQPLWKHTLCFVRGRIDFFTPEGPAKSSNGDGRSNSGHGSVFVFIGRDWTKFTEVFGRFGAVVRRISDPLPEVATAEGDSASGDEPVEGEADGDVLGPTSGDGRR